MGIDPVTASIAATVGSQVVGGIMGGGSPDAPSVNVWQPPNTGDAANTWQALTQQNAGNNPYKTYAPDFLSVFSNLYNNQYASPAQTAANAAGGAYTTTGNQQAGAGTAVNNAALATLPAAQQVLNMGMDPQSDLYKRTVQQLQDQVRVAQSARGITDSPYGAGLEDSTMANFNIDWQNNALSRAMSSLDSYGKAVTNTAGQTTQAGTLGTSGAANIAQGGAAPYQTSTGIGNQQYDALANLMNALTGSNTVNQQTIADMMQYLGLSAGQSNTQNQDNINNYQNQLAFSNAQGVGANQFANAAGGAFSWLNAPSSNPNAPSVGFGANAPNVSNFDYYRSQLGLQ